MLDDAVRDYGIPDDLPGCIETPAQRLRKAELGSIRLLPILLPIADWSGAIQQ
jgi:hypothetical protein